MKLVNEVRVATGRKVGKQLHKINITIKKFTIKGERERERERGGGGDGEGEGEGERERRGERVNGIKFN